MLDKNVPGRAGGSGVERASLIVFFLSFLESSNWVKTIFLIYQNCGNTKKPRYKIC